MRNVTQVYYNENFHKQTFLNPERHGRVPKYMHFKSHLRFIYFGFIFVIHIEELINLTIGDFSLDVSGTGNALRVCQFACLLVYGFVSCVDL